MITEADMIRIMDARYSFTELVDCEYIEIEVPVEDDLYDYLCDDMTNILNYDVY
jgi:hypothetical protein